MVEGMRDGECFSIWKEGEICVGERKDGNQWNLIQYSDFGKLAHVYLEGEYLEDEEAGEAETALRAKFLHLIDRATVFFF